MPRLVHKQREAEHSLETASVCEIMDSFYQLYQIMSQDPCLEDLAGDVAELIVELDDRRELARRIAAEEENAQNLSVH